MEIDAQNGVVFRLGRKHGIATPFNQTGSRFWRVWRAKSELEAAYSPAGSSAKGGPTL
jgi:hypothetical protein